MVEPITLDELAAIFNAVINNLLNNPPTEHLHITPDYADSIFNVTKRLAKRKRTSKRRWIARAKLGKPIPLEIVVNYNLLKRMRPPFVAECSTDLYRQTCTWRIPSQS